MGDQLDSFIADQQISEEQAEALANNSRIFGRVIPLKQKLFKNKNKSKFIYLSTVSFEQFYFPYTYETMIFDGDNYSLPSTNLKEIIEQEYQWRYNNKDTALYTHKKIEKKIKEFLADKISDTEFINYLDRVRVRNYYDDNTDTN